MALVIDPAIERRFGKNAAKVYALMREQGSTDHFDAALAAERLDLPCKQVQYAIDALDETPIITATALSGYIYSIELNDRHYDNVANGKV